MEHEESELILPEDVAKKVSKLDFTPEELEEWEAWGDRYFSGRD